MIYVLSAIFVFLLSITLAVIGYSPASENPRFRRLLLLSNAVLGITGAVIAASAHIFISLRISEACVSVSAAPSFSEWAANMLNGWYSVSLPTVVFLLGINIFAAVFSLFDKKQQKKTSVFLRHAVLAVSSAVPLILAPFYGFMTENETLPLYPAILVSGIGMALVFRAAALIELCAQHTKTSDK